MAAPPHVTIVGNPMAGVKLQSLHLRERIEVALATGGIRRLAQPGAFSTRIHQSSYACPASLRALANLKPSQIFPPPKHATQSRTYNSPPRPNFSRHPSVSSVSLPLRLLLKLQLSLRSPSLRLQIAVSAPSPISSPLPAPQQLSCRAEQC